MSVLLLAFIGCSGASDRMRVVPAGGSVTYNGEPVAGADVIFLSTGSDPAAVAKTGPDGRFRLRTYEEQDGAAPGQYKVMISKMEGGAAPPSDPSVPFDAVADMEAAAKNKTPTPPARSLLPQKYATDSPLEFTVQPSGANEFQIVLTDE